MTEADKDVPTQGDRSACAFVLNKIATFTVNHYTKEHTRKWHAAPGVQSAHPQIPAELQ